MKVQALLLVALFVALAHCHVFPLGIHKHEAVSLKAGPNVYPLQGNINQYAEFFVNLSIGTPPQFLRVQVDTGSTDLVVFATGCDKCPTASNETYFNPSKSKTNNPISCDDDEYDCDVNNCWDDDLCPLEIQYGGGGSINGYAARDSITFGSLTADCSVGLIQQISGPFENLGIDGCWGLAYEGLSSWGDDSVIDHLTYDNKLYGSFSLCLTPENPVMEIGTNYQGNSAFEWTKVTEQDWFTVDMEDFFVGGKSLGISKFTLNENGVIADSGTTLFIVSKKVMDGVQASLTSLCSPSVQLPGVCSLSNSSESLFNGFCFPMTQSQIGLFPNISTSLKDMASQIVIPPQAYLWEGAGIEGTYCLGLQYMPSADSLPIILGDIVLQNYHVVFDKEKNMVGWGDVSTPTQRGSTLSLYSNKASSSSSPVLTPEDREMLRDVKFRKFVPGISKSQEFDTKARHNKQSKLIKSNSHSPSSGNRKEFLSIRSLLPVIDFEIDRTKALDMIDNLKVK